MSSHNPSSSSNNKQASTGPTAAVTLDHSHHHHHHNNIPMDLAPRGPSVVQLTPVQPVFSSQQVGGGSNNSIVAPPGTPIISVNRTPSTNLTLLPARPSLNTPLLSSSNNSSGNNNNSSSNTQQQLQSGQQQQHNSTQQVQVSVGPVGSQQPAIPTYQITRVTGVRTSNPGQPQPSAITVTPISTSSLSANIRLAGATMNNGTWAPTTFSPIRAATITVGGRPVRPDGKTIHIPQGPVQHVTQLQVVDSKGTLIKPQLTTPIMNIRGQLPGGGSSGNTVALPLFRATAGIATAIQQRPQTGNNSSGPNTVHKVIHQSQISQLTPIQFVQNKNSHVIQALPPSKLNAVCLTLPTSGNIVQQANSSPVGVVARQSGPSLLVAPSNLTPGGQGANAPGITKVYPVGRGDGLEQLFSSNPSSTSSPSGSVTVSAVTVSGTPTSVVVATPSHSQQQHLVVHATPTINVGTGGGLPPPNLATGSIAPSYFVERNLVVHSSPSSQQLRPIALDNKKTVESSNTKPGQLGMIFTTTTQPLQQTVTIPLAAHQHINLNHHHPHHSHGGQTQILTQIHGGLTQHHLTYTAVSSAPSITVTGPVTANPTSGSQGSPSTGGPGPPQQPTPSSISSNNNTSSNNNNGPQVTSSVLTVTTTSTTSNNSSNTSASTNSVVVTSSSCGVSGSGTITTSATTTTSSQPAQSPKSTHSPRPSILRKRELGESHLSTASQSAASSRVQRNLTMSLNFAASAAANNNKENETSSTSNSSSNKISRLESVSSCSVSSGPSLVVPFGGPTSVMTTTTTTSCSSGISILKKEFQPPTEESSWQSVSSNSSSGSSTISTTSETAELQMQQQQQLAASSVLIDFGSNSSHNHSNRSLDTIHLSSAGSTGLSSFTGATSNGVVKGSGGGPAGRSARTSSNTTGNKALERVKASAKDKEDAMSPRKKPRKQQLTSSDLLEAASPEIYYQGKGKGRYRRSELMDFARGSMAGNDMRDCRDGERVEEVEAPPRKVYRLNYPRLSLLKYNSVPQKPLTNHFLRYSDVKAKEEKRPSITDLANQKGIQHRVSGWRLKYVTAQMDDVIHKEDSVVNKFSESLARLEDIIEPNCNDHDLNRVMELLKGNIQRCKVIRDQMMESRSQVMKILDHRPQLAQVINKSCSKRPQKKRDRL